MADSDRTTRWRNSERRSGLERRARPTIVTERGGASPDERRAGQERRNEAAWERGGIAAASGGVNSEDTLIAAALDVRMRARAAYSNFKVGAALETDKGRVFGGCNIENATYGLTLCAERVALVKALSEGATSFTCIAVVADTVEPTPPCGPCRQLLWEYCGDIDVILGNLNGPIARYKLSALLPMPFDARLLR